MPFELFPKEKRKRTLTSSDKKRVAARQGWQCKSCGSKLQARFHVDHIKRFSDGGSDRESNLQALCSNCHDEKNEQERHKARQKKIRENESQETGLLGGVANIFSPQPKSRNSGGILGAVGVFPKSTRKSRSNELTLFGGQQPTLFGSPKRKKKSENPFDFGL